MKISDNDVIRFWDRVDKKDLCWEWMAGKNGNGYGVFHTRVDGRWVSQLAHRVAYAIEFGEVPDDLCVLHKCDNPACVYPDHLFLGTQNDNMKDAATKGRTAVQSGELSGMSKLTWREVCEIRLSSFTPQHEIADWYSVSQRSVSLIRMWRTWQYIGEYKVGEWNGVDTRFNSPRLRTKVANSKLTQLEADAIRVAKQYSIGVIRLSQWYNVSDDTIYRIWNGQGYNRK